MRRSRHTERCKDCKATVQALLAKIYGEIKSNHSVDAGTLPEGFTNLGCHEKLKEIFVNLSSFRGFNEFVRTRHLPPCDFFIPNLRFVVEFDESQHFTAARKQSLKSYGNSTTNLQLGFDSIKWASLCDKINAKDNDPPYRDEQRAWYDTLRDFLPLIKGFNPTVRLFARDFQWCSLDPENPNDVKKFESFLKPDSEDIEIKISADPNPEISRIIIAGKWSGDVSRARKILEDVCNVWPEREKVKFLITPGAFIQFHWPPDLSREKIGDNKSPNPDVFKVIFSEAEKAAREALPESLQKKLSEKTRYLTLGVDSHKEKISTAQTHISHLHVELICLVDLRKNTFDWTAKSYPTTGQEKGLVRLPDLESHFFDLEEGRTMILGCHDLTIFNDRNLENTTGWRKDTKLTFRKITKQTEPKFVLQHPHVTDSIRTWAAPISWIKHNLPSVKHFASAGRFFPTKMERGIRSPLNSVLSSTKIGSSLDFVVETKKTYQ